MSETSQITVCNIAEEGRLSGPTRRIALVGEALERFGVSTVVLIPRLDSARLESELATRGVRYAQLNYARLTLEKRELIRYVMRFPLDLAETAWFLRKQEVDLVHVNGSYQFRSAIAAFIARKKVIWHVNDAKMHWLVKAVFEILSPLLSDGFIFSSNVARSYYFSRGFDMRRFPSASIAPPVEVEQYAPAARGKVDQAARLGAMRVVTVTGINPDKGVDCFIEVAAIVHRVYPEVRFVVAAAVYNSQKKYFDELKVLMRARNLPEGLIEFVGFVDDVPQFLAQGDIFLYTSNTEAGPTAVWEAMAAGLPVVTTNVGAIPEYLVDGVQALIALPREFRKLADHTLRLIAEPGLRAALGLAAWEAVTRNFSVEAAAKKHVDIYRKVVESE